LVLGENIQQTLQFAQTGNADIAIVSASLGRAAGGQFVPIPDKLHNPIYQAIGAIKSSSNLEGSRKFIAFVLSKEGRAILKKYSFTFREEGTLRPRSASRRAREPGKREEGSVPVAGGQWPVKGVKVGGSG
jgi:molybdate transport system substrate-binding protein